MKRSKRYKQQTEKIDADKTYTLTEALTILQEAPVKFDAGIELHIKLGIDTKKSDQVVKGTVVLPHGNGKTKKVMAFVSPEKEAEAKEAGADMIGNDEAIEEIKKTGKCDFDVAIATPDMMKKVAPIAKILGQKGLMPNPKTETVGPDVKKMITELKAGKTAYRSDDGGNVHFLVGRISFSEQQTAENITAVIDSVKKAKPAEAKGVYIQQTTVSSSMGPGVPVSIA